MSITHWRDPATMLGASGRLLLAIIIGLSLTIASGGIAVAYTAGSGFSATTYATLPSGTSTGIAFVGNVMYSLDSTSGSLYRTATAGTTTLVVTIPGTPTGLAYTAGFLYATRAGTNDVIQIDPALGTFTTTAISAAFADLQLSAIAADPVNGDLYISSALGYIWAIRTPLTPSAPEFVTQLTGAPRTYGIAVASDHSVYVAVGGTTPGVWQAQGPIPGPIGTALAAARGVGVVPGYVFVNNADGTITKLVIPGAGTGSTATALTGGLPGGLAAIGFDGCFYASQGPAVVRLASADGSCAIGKAAPPPPPPTLTLALTSTGAAHLGADQSFTASLANVAAAAGIPVTFTVTRGTTTTTYVATTGPNGAVAFGYQASTTGTDIVTASAVINGMTVISDPITVTWLLALDTVPPTIRYVVTGTPGTNFSCPSLILGTPGETEYCGWYVSPLTITWSVTAAGTSGIDWSRTTCEPFTLTVSSPLTGTARTCIAYNGDGVSSALKVVLQAVLSTPTITASATTVSGPYVAGTATNQTVTVAFACATDASLGLAGVSFCSAPVTLSEGTFTVTGYVKDVAGTRVDATFGPIVVDKTAPLVTPTMKTATDGLPYTPGTPTTQDVIVSFACTDAVDPNPSCPSPLTVTAGPSVTVIASDAAGNSKSYTFGGIVIDRSGPTVTAVVTPVPDANGNNAPSATVTVTAADSSGIGSITYSATGVQTIPSTAVLATGGPTTFAVPIVLNAVGTTTVTYTARDRLGNVSSTGTIAVKIIPTQPTTLTITSPSALAQGSTTVSATLLGSGGAPVVGKTVTFAVGTTTVTAVTDASGTATAQLALAPGSYALTATFAGATGYLTSVAGPQALLVFGATQFVIWGGNGVVPGQRIVFWGERWWDQANVPEKSKVKDFKGWADTVSGTTWRTKDGNSKPPETIGSYISVIVTTAVDKDGKGVRGNVIGHAILRVDSSYKNEPAKPVYGIVVAVLP